jgi:N-acetylneuraminic acid mutarotase
MSDIYVFGGYEQWKQPCAFAFKFDTGANEWSRLADMPFACKDHHASILHGKVYIVDAGVGGYEVLRFDFATSAWRTLARTNFRRDCGVSFVLDECLYAAGGGIAGTSVERYDVTTKTWATVSDMLGGRILFRAVCIEAEGPSGDQDLFDSLIAKALKQRT